MKVFIAVASAHLAYGGPAFSVTALATNLAAAGVDTGLWCPDGSAASVELAPSGGQPRLLAGSLGEAMAQFGIPDIVHDNGIWWAHNHRIARFALRNRVPRVVSLRGMLEPWARRHKRLKKSIAWRLYQARDLRHARALHVTSPQEQATIAALLPDAPIVQIANGVSIADDAAMAFARSGRQTEPRQALFLGRLHPVKGLPLLLRAWQLVSPPNWQLVIAGPDELGQRQQLESLIAQLGLGVCVTFAGPVSGDAKCRLLGGSQLFVLPSHSESFGMAVGEALAHGLPVLTTTNVPWPQLAGRRCGWRVDGTVEALARALGEATACPQETLAEMGKRGRALIADEFGWNAITERFMGLYAKLLSPSEKPGLP